MGSIVAILVFGAIYSIVYVVKNIASPSNGGGSQVFGENFPTVEILEPVPEEPVKAEPAVVPPALKTKAWQKKQAADRAPQTKSPVAQEPEKKERLVRLAGKTEAKRAFLYSEIFNRKY